MQDLSQWLRMDLGTSPGPERQPGMAIQAYFIVFHRYCFFFNKLKVCGNPALSKSTGIVFLTAFAHIMSVCHILVICAIFQTFSLLLYLVR